MVPAFLDLTQHLRDAPDLSTGLSRGLSGGGGAIKKPLLSKGEGKRLKNAKLHKNGTKNYWQHGAMW